jgi:hypothetical protein
MDLLERLESEYLPRLRSLEATLRERFPALRFQIDSSATGTLTTFQGHDICIECRFPDRTAEQPDNVALTIATCHLDRQPRVMADVCWGAPAGVSEDSLDASWTSSQDWPEADEQTLESLREAFPRLSEAFARAVARGTPP